MNNENELTAALATIEKCREITNCPAGVDLQDWVKRLAAERDEALNAERIWEKTMMEVCGEDGPASVAAEIRNLLALRDTALEALKSQVEQLAAENVGLRPLIAENWNMRDLLSQLMAGRPGGVYFNKWEKLIAEVLNATPATDRIAAGIKADGATAAGDYLKQEAQHMPVVERLMMQDAAEICYGTAARLREGGNGE